MSKPDTINRLSAHSDRARWIQLALCIISMMAIASPQYIWALFTPSLTPSLGVGLAKLQVTFSILIIVQTFVSPGQGFLVDRFGPRLLLSLGSIFTGLSWVLAANARSVTGLYLTYGLLGGLGTGIVYVGVVGHVVRWFPDGRGLATGLATAGYGLGAVVTTFPIDGTIRTFGYRQALLWFGVLIGVVGVIAAQGLRRPSPGWQTRRLQRTGELSTRAETRSFTPAEMLRTPPFWLMFAMNVMMSTSGMMVTSQIAGLTRDFGLTGMLVFGLPVLPLALSVDRVCNGLSRPFFGWVSDKIGRENTMVIAFSLEGIAMTLWLIARANAAAFVLLSGLVYFGWGEIFSLFPSTLTDTYGPRHATTNYGWLYTAQGVGSVVGGPVAALVYQSTKSWIPVFATIICMNFGAALLARFALKPLRQHWVASISHSNTDRMVAPRVS